MTSQSENASLVNGTKRAWALIDPASQRRLSLISLFGVVISFLDAASLLMVFALISLLANNRVSGVAGEVVRFLGLATSGRYGDSLILLAVTAGLFIARSLLSIFALWLQVGAANEADATLISSLLIGHARAPQLMRLERNSSEVLRTIAVSVDQVVFGVISSAMTIVGNVAVLAAVAAGLALSSPLVALTVSAYFATIGYLWSRLARQALRRQGTRVQALQGERYRLILQGLGAAKELQLRGRAVFYAESASAATRGINNAMRGLTVRNGSVRYVLETALVTGTVLVVGVAGLTGGKASVLPAVGLLLASAFRLLPALTQILALSNAVQYNEAAIGVVEREAANYGGVHGGDMADDSLVAPHVFVSELRLNGVSFRYPTREEDAVCGVSAVVKPGEHVGIIGPTGSGKSTLLDIALGFLEPSAGEILLDGAPLAQQRESWQRSIGYVPQDVYLVDETLRANVALGWRGDEIDDTRVVEAVRAAGLEEVVARLPDGLNARLGERGVRLSGGQRQRVGIARALYTRPSVLVLDEATSNLDRRTEARITETLAALRGDITMLVVTHRTQSVHHCDWILYLQDAKVRATGTFAEVVERVPELEETPRGELALPPPVAN